MLMPRLVPRPGGVVSVIASEPQPVVTHSEEQWVAVYPEIQRLYVQERRRLRYLMRYMESEHGFTATEQMYKKRFSKWGFQKNAKRSNTTVRSLGKEDACKGTASGKASSMPVFSGLDHCETAMLIVLTSMRTWSTTFFESVHHRNGLSISQQRPYDSKEANFAFKLAIDLLDRGRGDLAGRMARKAFLLVENMLLLEGPALMWNLLEIMHHMVKLHHVRLFYMLLAHVTALADNQLPESHPLPSLLRGLQRLISTTTNAAGSCSPASLKPVQPPSIKNNGVKNPFDPCLLSCDLLSFIERAWILNAKILFEHLDSRLFQLYFSMFWESCSIGPPAALSEVGNQWVNQIESQPMEDDTISPHSLEEVCTDVFVEEDKMTQRLLSPRMDASPPSNFEILRRSSLAALQERGKVIFSKGPDSDGEASLNGDTAKLLPMFAGLGTAKFLEGSARAAGWPSLAQPTVTAPRIHAGNVACVVRTLIDLHTEHDAGGPDGFLDDIERNRAVVTLREFANGETDPQVVREIWLLQNALVVAGQDDEAQKVEQDAYRRVERYVCDIPLHSA